MQSYSRAYLSDCFYLAYYLHRLEERSLMFLTRFWSRSGSAPDSEIQGRRYFLPGGAPKSQVADSH